MQVTLSMSDLNRVLGDVYRKVREAPINSDDTKEALLQINTDDFDPGQGFEEAILPIFVAELKFAHRQKYGEKALFVVSGSYAAQMIEAINFEETQKIAFGTEEKIESSHQIRMATPKSTSIQSDLRRFYLKALEKGDIPNFRAAIRISLALARLDEVNVNTLETSGIGDLLKAFIDDVNLGTFSRVVVALVTADGEIQKVLLPPIITFPINQWIQAASLAERTTAQAA